MLKPHSLKYLNQLSEKLKNEYYANKTAFYEGKLLETTASLCFDNCPYSVVVVLFTEQNFFEYGEELLSQLKARGLTPVKLVIDSKGLDNSIEMVATSLPENARLILTVDRAHIYNTQALAKELCVKCVIGLEKFPTRLFESLNPPPTDFIISQSLKIDFAGLYESVVNNIISLLDIKLKQFFKITPKNEKLTLEFTQILDSALEGKRENLLESAIALELIASALGHCEKPCDIKTTLCKLKLIAVNLTKTFLSVPSYITRAKAVSELYGLDYLQTLESFKAQLDRQRKFSGVIKDVKKGLSALADIYLARSEELLELYYELGGRIERGAKATREVLQTLKYSGDIHYYNNSMSLLRETGYLEKIK